MRVRSAQGPSIRAVNRWSIIDSRKSLDAAGWPADAAGMIDRSNEPCILRRVDRAKNMARFYRLSLEPSLFGDVALVREWGRIGTRGRIRVDLFPRIDEACKAFATIARSKRQRGYIDGSVCPGGTSGRIGIGQSRPSTPRFRPASGDDSFLVDGGRQQVQLGTQAIRVRQPCLDLLVELPPDRHGPGQG